MAHRLICSFKSLFLHWLDKPFCRSFKLIWLKICLYKDWNGVASGVRKIAQKIFQIVAAIFFTNLWLCLYDDVAISFPSQPGKKQLVLDIAETVVPIYSGTSIKGNLFTASTTNQVSFENAHFLDQKPTHKNYKNLPTMTTCNQQLNFLFLLA